MSEIAVRTRTGMLLVLVPLALVIPSYYFTIIQLYSNGSNNFNEQLTNVHRSHLPPPNNVRAQ
eukprot:scaffold2370_cov102-Skeletonema_dohrnii-CCMP3373.AAC.5